MTPLPAAIDAFITCGEDDPDAFDHLARRVFAHQYHQNALYRAFCEGRGAAPGTIASWRDIPAAPAAAFKRFALSCVPEAACVPERGGRIFHSSGTTGGETSRHFLDGPALNLYRASLRAGFRRFVFPDGAALPILALMPPPQGGTIAAPRSSLSFMLGELIADYGGRFFAEEGWQRDLARALHALSEPLVIFGTAFAWMYFFDASCDTFALPPGSRVVETGGFKGRSREVSRGELCALFTSRLGVPPTHCLGEYGMSEMASQFYDSTLRDHVLGVPRGQAAGAPRKVGPPWLRTRIVDPITGEDVVPSPLGAPPGLLRHYDLANLNSVFALQTEDYGHAAPDGDGFLLTGRAPGAVIRGCSLTAEELAARQGRAS